MDKREISFQARCKRSGLKKGDTVKILGKAESGEDGWGVGWSPSMDDTVGKVGVINHLGTSSQGFNVNVDGSADWNYPYWLLKKVDAKVDAVSNIVKLNDTLTAEIKGDYIKVGCQTIKFSAITELVERIGTLEKGKRKR